MKVIVDNKIPYIREAIEQIADEVIYTPGKDFTPELVQDADALIIRTRTRCDRSLLAGSKVKFIATATITQSVVIFVLVCVVSYFQFRTTRKED